MQNMLTRADLLGAQETQPLPRIERHPFQRIWIGISCPGQPWRVRLECRVSLSGASLTACECNLPMPHKSGWQPIS